MGKLDPAARAQLIHKLADLLPRVVDYLSAGFLPGIVNSVSGNTHHQNENNSYNDIHTHTQLEIILEYIQSGKKVGDKGYFIRPTIFTNVKDDMKIAREENISWFQLIFPLVDPSDIFSNSIEILIYIGIGIIG
ncbi:unnamed protein product [Rotaria sordida]|uniref:Aldehyde dehydrogenase domain-containing protein n=1 Tax=Rotaria sordida TaxID=392033 RepID=A0A815Q4I3_9BILA|nr:unnamed protein product [Rotaria sordida]